MTLEEILKRLDEDIELLNEEIETITELYDGEFDNYIRLLKEDIRIKECIKEDLQSYGLRGEIARKLYGI